MKFKIGDKVEVRDEHQCGCDRCGRTHKIRAIVAGVIHLTGFEWGNGFMPKELKKIKA